MIDPTAIFHSRSSAFLPGLLLLAACGGDGGGAGESHPPPTRLTFIVAPVAAAWGSAFSDQPVIEIQDDAGALVDTVTRAVTVTLIDGGGAVLSGTGARPAVAGVASFAGLSVDRPVTGVRLVATSAGLVADTSAAFDVGGPPADHLVFATIPAGATGGLQFLTQPVVEVRTAGGQLVTWYSGMVTVALGAGGGGGVLSGTPQRPFAAGKATFIGLRIDSVGAGYTLVATSPGLLPDTSAGFDVALGSIYSTSTFVPDDSLLFVGDSTWFTVVAKDAGGNLIDAAPGELSVASSGVGTFSAFVRTGVATYRASFKASAATPGFGASFTLSRNGAVTAAHSEPGLQVLGVAAVTAGDAHTCATLTNGRLYCWGASGDGRLGLGAVGDTARPVQVGTAFDWAAVRAGWKHTCGFRQLTSTLWCWGDNSWGQLLTGDHSPYDTPHQADAPADLTGLALGKGWSNGGAGASAGYNTCVRRSDDTIDCSGDDRFGQLGIGTDGNLAGSDSLRQILTATRFTDLAVGASIACGIATNVGWVWCWGDDSKDQLGKGGEVGAGNCADGAGPCVSIPVIVSQSRAYDTGSLSVGVDFGCAVSGGALYCWGTLPFGGSGLHDSVATAMPVAGAQRVAVGAGFLCTMVTNGQVGCLGSNAAGQLGAGPGSDRATFAPISGGGLYTQIAAGGSHACAIEAVTLRLWCWGANANGQLGDGSHTDRDIPVAVRFSP